MTIGSRCTCGYPTDILSGRERETLSLYAELESLAKVAEAQSVTLGTIKRRWQNIKDKLGIERGSDEEAVV
jgi:DNA-binding CsgD family transcriptional regulator